MPNEQVYYVLANPPTPHHEPEKRSSNRGLFALALIGVGAYLIYQHDKKIVEAREEAKLADARHKKYESTYKPTI